MGKLRQDGDGDGGFEGIAGVEGVGEQVGNLIAGVATGDFNGILGGAVSFIPEEDTKNGVGQILKSVAPFLNQGLKQGIQYGQQYFGIGNFSTTAAPRVVASAVGQPGVSGTVPANGALTAPGAVGGAVPPALAQPVQSVAAVAEPATATTPNSDDDGDDDEESENEAAKKLTKL
jgi:hypothetical protein